MTLIAKPILENELWIVLDGNKKVGIVRANPSGYTVNIGSKQSLYPNTDSIENISKIEFERMRIIKHERPDIYQKFPNTGKSYNEVFDVQRKIHLYTKSPESKCYYASGWFNIKISNKWTTIFCPKYLLLQRYQYNGPYLTRTQAEKA